MGPNTFKVVDNRGIDFWLVRGKIRSVQQNRDYRNDFLVEFRGDEDVEFTFDTEEEAKETLERLIAWLDE